MAESKPVRPREDFQQGASPEFHPRGRAESAIVYPVISRRAGGLSLGINLFPERKVCSYDCPYCEVPAFSNPGMGLAPGDVRRALEGYFRGHLRDFESGLILKDISISGNGEPTLSPLLEEALYAGRKAIETCSLNGNFSAIKLVLITNSSGFLRAEIRKTLMDFYAEFPFEIWAKLDGGSKTLHEQLSRSSFSYQEILDGLIEFSRAVPLTLQTMVLEDARTHDTLLDCEAYAESIHGLLEHGGHLNAVQLYTVARLPAESWILPVSDEVLIAYARKLSSLQESRNNKKRQTPTMYCYGSHGEVDWVHGNR
jgi:histidinol dehydrogenase